MKKTIKFYFNLKDYIENSKQIMEQLYCEGYKSWLSFSINEIGVVYAFIGEE